MSEVKLKPCPFCGGEAHFERFVLESSVSCKVCRAVICCPHKGGKEYSKFTGDKEVIKLWNTRPSYSVSSDRLTLLEYQRLVSWMKDPNRKPANIEFTASACRDAGKAFEEYLSSIPKININGKWVKSL